MLSSREQTELSLYFPKLRLVQGKKRWWLRGDIDLCDEGEEFLRTYKVEVEIPTDYPHGVPVLWEIGKLIPWEDERHVAHNGKCCVAMEHILQKEARKGLCILRFIRGYVRPFLANQLIYEDEGTFANGDYEHGDDGILQFYHVDLDLTTAQAIRVLLLLKENKWPTRNDLCFCGSRDKFKNCHLQKVAILRSVNRAQLDLDLSVLRAKLATES